MDKYCIIAGGGRLPSIIKNLLINKGNEVFIIGIKNNFESSKFSKKIFEEVKIGSIGKILRILKNKNIKKIIFAGSIKRPNFNDISLDYEAIKLLRHTKITSYGDNALFKKIASYFEVKGFKFVSWYKYFPNLFTKDDILTIHKPTKNAIQNLQKGLSVYKYFSKSDVGQSLIIQNNLILGLEAIEGTDKLIKRCFFYKRKSDKGILIKLKKYNQDLRFDLPTVGINTLKLLKKYNYEGVYIQKKYCLLIDKEKVIDFANQNKMFISGLTIN